MSRYLHLAHLQNWNGSAYLIELPSELNKIMLAKYVAHGRCPRNGRSLLLHPEAPSNFTLLPTKG